MTYYAVAVGRVPGVYETWAKALEQISGFPGARHQKFGSELDALAFVAAQLTIKKPRAPRAALPASDVGGVTLGPPRLGIPELTVYTDGACTGNGTSGARAGYGVFFGPDDRRNVGAPLPDDAGRRTNNRAELYAVLHALRAIATTSFDAVDVVTDSRYVLLALRRALGDRPAKSPPPNLDLIDAIVAELRGPALSRRSLLLRHVRAHQRGDDVDVVGNREADRLAVEGASLDVA